MANELVVGKVVLRTLMVKKLERKVASNKNPFFSGEVFDKEGTYAATIWEVDDFRSTPEPGDVIEAGWKVKEWNSKLQLDIDHLLAHHAAKDVEDVSAFVKTSSVTREEWTKLYSEQVRPLIEDDEIAKFLDKALLEPPFDRGFFTAPAAKGMHHPWRGGLAEHVYRLLKLFLGLCASGHPGIVRARKGLVIAGLCLHDWGKALEYVEVAPGQYDVGRWGGMLGHLAGGPIVLAKMAETFGIDPQTELGMHLFHVLLSHHGQIDWGSPVVPVTLEATIVHHLDNLDGKLSPIEEAKDGEFIRTVRGNVAHYRTEG